MSLIAGISCMLRGGIALPYTDFLRRKLRGKALKVISVLIFKKFTGVSRANFLSLHIHTKMGPKGAFYFAITVAVFYQVFLKSFLFTFLNIRGVLQPLEIFDYDCQRISHPLLESCEDLWLDRDSRALYAACGDMISRQNWVPA